MEKNLNRYGYGDDNIGIITEKQQLLDNQDETDGKQNKRLNKLEEGTVIETTYSELVEKRDNGELTPGYFYRITDYECTTTLENTQSAGHSFDIIVQATSESALNENAKATNNENDTYFRSANANLDAWELKYCLDNDTDRFEWADEDGKGVVYYMKDEWNNECPYDFKNIQFKRYKITACPKSPDLVGKYSCDNANGITVNHNNPYWVYTFTVIDTNEDDIVDVSTLQHKFMNDEGSYSLAENNKISDYYNYIMSLPDNVFVTDTDLIDEDGGFYSYYSNTFGNNCGRNTFGNYCYYNTFGNYCQNNTFGNNCYSNTFGNTCQNNTFGNNCYYNTFGNSCYQNTFGNSCGNNTFGNTCYQNTFGNSCGNNTFGNDCYYNTFGNECYSNTFGNYCYYNTFGNSCTYNTFGNDCGSNTFGNNASSPQSYFRWIIFDNGNQNINLICNDDLSSSSYCQNVHVLQGVNNSNTRKNIEIDVANQSYQMCVGLKTGGVIVVYNPTDLVNT